MSTLLLTEYAQVCSVAAAPAGDWAAVRDGQLVLSETGLYSSGEEDGSCCAAPLTQTPIAVPSRRAAPVRELALAGAGVRRQEIGPAPSCLEAASVSACRTLSEQGTCCHPSEQADCRGSSTDGSRGC